MDEVKDIDKKENKKKKKEKTRKPVDKMKIATKIFAIVVVFLMLFSVCGTLLYYIMQG